jgi:hypothetical protein
MGWVVKEWQMDGLERLLADEARDAVRVAREAAERDARRARRAATRTAAEAAAQLDTLECIGTELQAAVGARRSARPSAPAPAPERVAPRARAADPAPPAPGPAPAAAPRPTRRRPGRASLRNSPLAELFRATGAV